MNDDKPTLIVKAAPGGGQHGSRGGIPAPFVVGASRSGTTLLRLMLDAHPELAIPPETHFIPRLVQACQMAADPRDGFAEVLTAGNRWVEFGLDPAAWRRVAGPDPFDLGDGLRAFYRLYAERFGKPRWGDKTPPYLHRMQLIQRLLPEARFVHLIRDGRDVALSHQGLWFGPTSVRAAARWWTALIAAARAQVDDLRFYLEVRYEDLVREPEATLRRVCAFVELPWHPTVLDYHARAQERLEELARPERRPDGRIVSGADRAAIHGRTSQPPDAAHVGRWRREMSVPDRQWFEARAGALLRELGYEVG
jgi:hypothetical protein